jgi:hypothetical protein
MRNDWMLVRRCNDMPDAYRYFVQPMHDHLEDVEEVIHTGTWDECAALGKILGCVYWYDSTALGKRWNSIEEPPDEK